MGATGATIKGVVRGTNHSNLSCGTMSDTLRDSRPGSARIAIIVLLVLAVVSLGATLVWQNYGPAAEPSKTASVQPTAQSQAPQSAEPSDETNQALNALQQAVKDLQASQQQMADQLSETKRERAAEQGEQKMLSEEVGSLVGRVDGLTAASGSVVAGTTATTSSKKKR
jgi:hypothetical protein